MARTRLAQLVVQPPPLVKAPILLLRGVQQRRLSRPEFQLSQHQHRPRLVLPTLSLRREQLRKKLLAAHLSLLQPPMEMLEV
jgi:hypothetical protein